MFTLENEIYTNFWNAMKGKEYDQSVLASITDNGSSALPVQSLKQVNETIKEENIFRKLGTVIQAESADGVIHAVTLQQVKQKLSLRVKAFQKAMTRFKPLKSILLKLLVCQD